MINIEVNDHIAAVTAKGTTKQLLVESYGLLIESFKIIRKLDEKLYEQTKEELFIGILSGKLDEVLAECDETNVTKMTVDMDELKKQLAQEEEEC